MFFCIAYCQHYLSEFHQKWSDIYIYISGRSSFFYVVDGKNIALFSINTVVWLSDDGLVLYFKIWNMFFSSSDSRTDWFVVFLSFPIFFILLFAFTWPPSVKLWRTFLPNPFNRFFNAAFLLFHSYSFIVPNIMHSICFVMELLFSFNSGTTIVGVKVYNSFIYIITRLRNKRFSF